MRHPPENSTTGRAKSACEKPSPLRICAQRARPIASDRSKALVQLPDPRRRRRIVRGMLGTLKRMLDLDQLAVAPERVFQCGHRCRRCFLADPCDGEARLYIHIARLRMQFTAEQCEQAAFATAVGPGDTDSLAREQREVGPREQALDTALQRDVTQ